jgi:membrane-bound serine protease (ClpP class)
VRIKLLSYKILLLLLSLPLLAPAQMSDSLKQIFIFSLEGDVDARTERSTDLALTAATEAGAELVILKMNTFGGAVDAADAIRTRILEYPKPVWVFINKNAASAGALISIACDSIYMAPGASIGAATVVTGTGEAAPDKYQSYMRSQMRATAEANGRDPRMAEAMVDERIYIPNVIDSGQVLTLSTSEAIRLGFCEGQYSSIDELLTNYKLQDVPRQTYELPAVEKVIAFFINPFVSGILILLIIGGLYFELQTPGVGFAGLAAAIALLLYLVPYYLNGLAEHWEVLMLILGIGLLALEIFVIPGFGIAGIGGLLLMVGSLVLMTLNNDWFDFEFVAPELLMESTLAVIGGFLGGILLIIGGGARLVNSKYFRSIALESVQAHDEGYEAHSRPQRLLGMEGVAYTVLRPSGKVMIADELYDAYTRGEYIEAGSRVLVIDDRGGTIRVRLLV